LSSSAIVNSVLFDGFFSLYLSLEIGQLKAAVDGFDKFVFEFDDDDMTMYSSLWPAWLGVNLCESLDSR